MGGRDQRHKSAHAADLDQGTEHAEPEGADDRRPDDEPLSVVAPFGDRGVDDGADGGEAKRDRGERGARRDGACRFFFGDFLAQSRLEEPFRCFGIRK